MRDDERMSKEELYEQTKIVLAKQEVAHFDFGSTDITSFLDKLRPVVRRYAKNGFRKPRDVSRLLNKAGMTTACGARWTPRLAWFLLGFLFKKEASRAATSAGTSPKRTSPEVPDAANQRDARKLRKERHPKTRREPARAPFTRNEVAKRMAALGRVLPRN